MIILCTRKYYTIHTMNNEKNDKTQLKNKKKNKVNLAWQSRKCIG